MKSLETEKWSATGRWVRWSNSGANSGITVFFNVCFLWKLPGLGKEPERGIGYVQFCQTKLGKKVWAGFL